LNGPRLTERKKISTSTSQNPNSSPSPSSETAAAAFWPDHPDILAGRDLRNGGTWCGVTRGGRFALLTNFREKDPGRVQGAPSRGALTLDFLRGDESPLAYLQGLELDRHNGFNLVVGDLNEEGQMEVAYVTNRSSSKSCPKSKSTSTSTSSDGTDGGDPAPSPSPSFPSGVPVLLPPGVYGLSNGVLGDSWCKVDRGVSILKEMLEKGEFEGERGNGNGEEKEPPSTTTSTSSSPSSPSPSFPWDALFRSLMGDTSRAPAHLLPETGIPRHIEEKLAPTFVTPFELLPKGGGGGGGGGGGATAAETAAAAAAAETEATTKATTAAADASATQLKKYGTRSQTALALFAGGKAVLRERRLVRWRESSGAAVAAGGEEGEEGREGKGKGKADTSSSLSLSAPPPFRLEYCCCPIQSEWREVEHEFAVRSLVQEEEEEEEKEGGRRREKKKGGGESEKELVVDEAGQCATVVAADPAAGEDDEEETELRTSP
jgi:uncharacterized protein with NRDE domain